MLGKNYIISASLVLYKTKISDLNNVLQSVIKSNIDILYIIDNSPTNELQRIVESYESKIFEYHFGHGNIGFGRGNNIGLTEAVSIGSKYHIVLNPDIIFNSETIDALADYMDTHKDVGQILPRVIYPNGNIQYLCKRLPTPIDIFCRRIVPNKYIKKINYLFEMHYTGYTKIWNCPILSGCFMFLRTSTLKEVGFFDPKFFMYFEDFDLMRRIHRNSKTLYYPYVSIIHNHAAEHRHNSRLLKESIKSAIKYFNKWGWIFDKERKVINKLALKPNI